MFVAALAFYDLTHTFTAPDPGGKDAGFEALEHVEPQGTLIACFVPPWSWYPFNEVPDLAGYFGHRFYFLRHGRWTTAHPRREELEKNQMLLVSSPTRAEAVAVARKEGVTHVMVFPGAIPGWLLGQTPVHKNERWAVFDVRPLL